jgi:chemotaxis protein CheZ
MPAMTDNSPQRMFTAELTRRGDTAAREDAGPPDQAAVRHNEIMQALTDLRGRITVTPPGASSAADAHHPQPPTPARDEGPTEAALRCELRALHGAIDDTRREIAALRQMGKPPAHLATATDELDAVVHATESATECILAASERIDELLTGLRNQAGAEEVAGIEAIGEQVTRIFESCNFQDITGQRITKVVNALKFVEERVNRMIEVLGGTEAIEEVEAAAPAAASPPPDDDSHLLCGPQLDQHKISQDDIDRFFS